MTLADMLENGLGAKALSRVACVAKPETILALVRRKLIAQKFDGSKHCDYPGRPRMAREDRGALIVRVARENSGWGYDRIAGALSNLGHQVSDQTVGSNGVATARDCSQLPGEAQTYLWKDFIAAHMSVLLQESISLHGRGTDVEGFGDILRCCS